MAEKDKYKYRIEIQQMMFVIGETNDPPTETTSLVEDIVRSQVIEMLLQATILAQKRGARSMATEDFIFLIRHDAAKVSRLKTYLTWKDVRKNAKDQEAGGLEGTDILENGGAGAEGAAAGGAPGGPGAPPNAPPGQAPLATAKRSKVKLPWEMQFMFSEQPLQDGDDEEDEEAEANSATIERLKTADERTKDMTREEYVHWSECRQASFTYRKAKRFRDWAGIGALTDTRPHDDIIDILGFLTFEIIASITEEALKVKEEQEEVERSNGDQPRKKQKMSHSLFDGPDEEARPILACHVQEAYRRLQHTSAKQKSLRRYRGGLVKVKTTLI